MIVSIINPVFNNWKLTSSCLQSLAKTTQIDGVEVIVVDNGLVMKQNWNVIV